MINLHEESIYLQGARDVLMRLKDDFEMYLIPSVKCKTNPTPFSATDYCYFPLSNTKMRKILGEAVRKTLIEDRESLVNFLYGTHDGIQIKSVNRDKKGNINSIEVKL